jgi:hypothetical protein
MEAVFRKSINMNNLQIMTCVSSRHFRTRKTKETGLKQIPEWKNKYRLLKSETQNDGQTFTPKCRNVEKKL